MRQYIFSLNIYCSVQHREYIFSHNICVPTLQYTAAHCSTENMYSHTVYTTHRSTEKTYSHGIYIAHCSTESTYSHTIYIAHRSTDNIYSHTIYIAHCSTENIFSHNTYSPTYICSPQDHQKHSRIVCLMRGVQVWGAWAVGEYA